MIRTGWAWLLLVAVGCGQAGSEAAAPAPPTPATMPTGFDPATAGTVRGRVTWVGDVPRVAPFEIATWADSSSPRPRLVRENPHAPIVDTETQGVAGAVVFLDNVDAQRARPWDHAAVCVEFRNRRLLVLQGGTPVPAGFVRLGDAITMVSREPEFNALHASGAAFFSLAFPDADRPLTRVRKTRGHLELTSTAGAYWMRGHLFVDDHPYYAQTDRQGHFDLRKVPPGRYRVVCWLPNWHVLGRDRDAESGLVTRLAFRPPLRLEQDVVLGAGGEAKIEFRIDQAMFP